MNKPFDIKLNGKMIVVKSCGIYRRKAKRGKPVRKKQAGWWNFTAGKQQADYYLCFCLVEQKLVKTYLIPGKIFGKGVCLGQQSKYDKYIMQPPGS